MLTKSEQINNGKAELPDYIIKTALEPISSLYEVKYTSEELNEKE